MQRLTDKEFWIHLVIFLLILGLLGGFVYLFREFVKIKSSESGQVSTQNVYPVTYVTNTSSPAPTIIETPTPTPLRPFDSAQGFAGLATPVAQKVTSYIPFSSSLSTTSTDWVDVPGAQAYVDLKNNYSSTAYVTWEASMHVISGGQVTARLLDKTHGIEVTGSKVSASSMSSTLVSSGQLNLWSGNNLYQVQIESLDSNTVTFDSGRIKIVY